MFDNILNLFKRKNKEEVDKINKEKAKERLHLVLMQDRANVSADFLDLMKQEIIDVIKKYIDVDEDKIDVKLTNKLNGDGTTGAPALYANIPIKNIKKETRINSNKDVKILEKVSEKATKVDKTTIVTAKPETKENNNTTVNTIQSKTNSEGLKGNNTNTTGTKTINTKSQIIKNQNNSEVSSTTVSKETANSSVIKSKPENSLQNTVNTTNNATSNETTTVNIATNNNVSQVTANKKDEEKSNVVKEEKDDNNNKNGNNEKVEENKAETENKAIKMNKKKTTFFENVPHKKK